ncbi:SprT family zinc-dependent metalloprotease [uncultured Ruminococcus sp.]|uniref:M48 family metallopeptidase n=1 Tax=uncultured Ruminococcus sp. TaxID=165186 RepID=UPI0025D15776|nr:SprT family zinc-dependent metalloprotease [uncultured Ruminococcus sp.]
MDTINFYLGQINGTVKIQLIRKKIKNVHLKVFRSLDVTLSVPNQVPNEWIESFLLSRREWIDTQITKYKKSSGHNNLTEIRNGSSTQFLGKDIRIYKEASLNNYVELNEKSIILYLTNVTDDLLVQKVFSKWWRQTAEIIYQQEIDFFYKTVIKKYGINKPVFIIRKMKTLWGSCSPKNNKITLNEYLLKANRRCIQYVVLHELTHLLYPNHNSEFYDFLTIHMPDWIERKKQLDTEVVQSL